VGRGWHRPGLPPLDCQVQRQAARPAAGSNRSRDLYVWHWKNEKYLRNERPLARVGLVSTSVGRAAPDDHASGFYHALVEARIPFEMLRESQLDRSACGHSSAGPAEYRHLSDAQCAQLKAFVEKGGGLVATHETSLYDERGRRRDDFRLAGLFGASFAGSVIERQQNAYLNLEDHSHPLLAGLEYAGRMIHGVKRVEIRTAPGLRAPLMTVPTYPICRWKKCTCATPRPPFPV